MANPTNPEDGIPVDICLTSTREGFITFRLYDSLPQKVLARIKQEIALRNPDNISHETFILAEKYLDKGLGQCFLRRREIAGIVRDSLFTLEDVRFTLYAWVVMPNHVHLLLKPNAGEKLDKLMHSIKSFTALRANRALGRTGEFWMREAFDRYIRDVDHFRRAFRYIENNPVKARLCDSPADWEFSSAWERERQDSDGTPTSCRPDMSTDDK